MKRLILSLVLVAACAAPACFAAEPVEIVSMKAELKQLSIQEKDLRAKIKAKKAEEQGPKLVARLEKKRASVLKLQQQLDKP